MTGQEKLVSVWESCLRIFSELVDKKPFEVWFKTIVPVSLQDNTLTVEVPTDFSASTSKAPIFLSSNPLLGG